MKCSKCNEDFEERDLQLSHDIPKYMGGTDKDGRHWLCKICHQKYEEEVLRVGLFNFIKTLPEKDKITFRNSAKIVRRFFFKEK